MWIVVLIVFVSTFHPNDVAKVSSGLFRYVSAFTSIRHLVVFCDNNNYIILQTTSLCLLILKLFNYSYRQVSKRYGHVPMVLVLHNVHVGFGYLDGKMRFFLWFSIYCPYLNLRTYVICFFVMFGDGQNLFENLRFRLPLFHLFR